jgi:hypothetical protein
VQTKSKKYANKVYRKNQKLLLAIWARLKSHPQINFHRRQQLKMILKSSRMLFLPKTHLWCLMAISNVPTWTKLEKKSTKPTKCGLEMTPTAPKTCSGSCSAWKTTSRAGSKSRLSTSPKRIVYLKRYFDLILLRTILGNETLVLVKSREWSPRRSQYSWWMVTRRGKHWIQCFGILGCYQWAKPV